jgi:hypothetical protein
VGGAEPRLIIKTIKFNVLSATAAVITEAGFAPVVEETDSRLKEYPSISIAQHANLAVFHVKPVEPRGKLDAPPAVAKPG